jgi:hypothetical protein
VSDVELRVSDADRDRAVARLREAHVEGRLTLEEFSERVELAYAARTRPELARTTEDLPSAPPVSRKRRRRFAIAIFGGPLLRGRWRAARRFFAVATFGGVDLDLREAQLDPGGLTIFSLAVFGGNDFYVPQGIEVDLIGLGVFGGNDEHGSEGEIHPGSPLVRIIALSVFGGTDVYHVPAGSGMRLGALRRAARGRLPGPPKPPWPPKLGP